MQNEKHYKPLALENTSMNITRCYMTGSRFSWVPKPFMKNFTFFPKNETIFINNLSNT